MLKILSWNIQHGGGTRVQKIVSKLAQSEAQIIVLSEFRNNQKGTIIRSRMLNYGYRFQTVSNAPKDSNSVIILSKLSGDSLLYPTADENFAENLVCLRFDAFTVCGVYLPHKKKHKLLAFMTAIGSDANHIFCGDFNTGKNGIDQKGNSFWYTDELEDFEASGYVDAFRLLHPEVKEYSWISYKGNGYRYDHSYVAEQLKPIVKACYYLHQWRKEKISDHAPMILELA